METKMMEILELSNGKAVYIDSKEFTRDEAHEIIIKLTGIWGTEILRSEIQPLLCPFVRGIGLSN